MKKNSKYISRTLPFINTFISSLSVYSKQLSHLPVNQWYQRMPVGDVMQFRRVQCIKVLFCLTTFILIVAYVQKLIFYVYYKFEAVQPPWPPSQLPRMVDYHFLQQKDLIYEPKILCWISTYPRNRLVSQENTSLFSLVPQHQENFSFRNLRRWEQLGEKIVTIFSLWVLPEMKMMEKVRYQKLSRLHC